MAGEAPSRIRWIRCRACALAPFGGCRGPVEAHHAGRDSGMGLRDHDDTAIPLCHAHHIEQWHGATGYFNGWAKAARRAWADRMVQRYRVMYEDSFRESDIPF